MRPRLEMLLVIVALATHTRGLPYGDLLPPQLQTQNQIVWYGNNRASQIQQNSVFPSYKDVPQQTGEVQFNWDQSQQNTFKGCETYKPSESQKQYNPEYLYQSPDQTLQPYAEDGFTVSCSGQNQVCVAKSLCIDGYVHPLKQGFIRPGQVQECKLSRETCCTVRYDLNNSPYDNQINTVLKDNQYPEPSLQNDQRYVPYGDNNQADVTELKPPLGNDAELQAAPNDKYAIESANQIRFSSAPTEKAPIDYQIPASSNQQNQYQTGDASASDPVFSPFKPAPTSSNSAPTPIFQFSIPAGCAAALLCVEEQYCTLEGVISQQPVTLTSKQLLRRVPLSSCRNSETGVVGKCCRDPNYVDPWPTGNLPANYTGGFDEQGFPTFLNIAKVPPPKKPVTQIPVKTTPKPPQIHEQLQPTNVVPLEPDNSDAIPQRVIPISPISPISTPIPVAPISTPAPFIKNPYDSVPTNQDIISFVPQLPNNPCGVRNSEQRPDGFRQTDAAFGEIPWQAMVLWSEERKILCSGALISSDVVLTAANCINRFSPNELSVKLGEWKLGYELAYEEPLPFEIIQVRTIKYHPGYVQGFSNNDTAVLLLEHPTTFNLHINTLCLPDYQVQEPSQCIVTGWGKSILQAHYAGAIMHMVDVDLLSHDVCQNRILGTNSHINIAHNVICGKAHNDNNMCQADIGAPLACYDGKGAYHIAGIYSQDTGCLPINQVATFSPIDIAWVKQIMSGTNIETAPTNIDDDYDYRKSNLPAGNEYLPPL